MPRKRSKPSKVVKPERAKRTTKPQRLPQPLDPEATGFRYTDLPMELRDKIVPLVVQNIRTVQVLDKGDGFVVAKHDFAQVCHLAHQDVSRLLSITSQVDATKICAKVKDFNFRPLSRFLRDLVSNPKVNLLQDFSAPHGSRKLFIDLELTKAGCRSPNLASLQQHFRWRQTNGQGLFMTYRFKQIFDTEQASVMLEQLDPQQPGALLDLVTAFRTWHMHQPKPKKPLVARSPDQLLKRAERDVRDYYDAIYEDMDRRLEEEKRKRMEATRQREADEAVAEREKQEMGLKQEFDE